MRALADGENVRRRMLKQIEDAKSFAIQGFCKDLLDVSFILNTLFLSRKGRELGRKWFLGLLHIEQRRRIACLELRKLAYYCVAKRELGRKWCFRALYHEHPHRKLI